MKRFFSRRRAQAGTSLIEAMVALAVFSIGILGVMQMNILASAQTGLASRETAAASIARDLVDTFERIPYAHTALATGTTHSLQSDWGTEQPLLGAASAIVDADGRNPDGSSRYAVTWNAVENIVNANGENAGKTIQINVTFRTTSAGTTKTVSFFTIKYNPDTVVGASDRFQEI